MNSKSQPTEREHSRFGPSSLNARQICNAWSGEDEDERKERGRSENYADEGTALHFRMETGKYPKGFKLNAEREFYIKWCEEYLDSLDIPRAPSKHKKVLREVRLDFKFLGLLGMEVGTADVLDLQGGHLVDWKFGFVPVLDAEINLQGIAYTIAAFYHNPDIDELTVHFPQPKLMEVTTHTFYRRDYKVLMARLVALHARCHMADEIRPRNYHADNCRFCARKTTCPIVLKPMADVAAALANYQDVNPVLPNDGKPPSFAGKVPKEMTALELSEAMLFRKVMEEWNDEVRWRALTKRRDDGEDIPYFKLCEKKGVSAIKGLENVKAVWAGIIEEVPMLTQEQFLEAVGDISVAKLLKAYANGVKGQKGKTMKGARQELMEALQDLGVVTTSDSSQYLLRDRSQSLG